MSYTTVCNTNIFINGKRANFGSFMPRGGLFMNSCFMPMFPPLPAAYLGGMCGFAAAPLIPDIFRAVGKGLSWFANKVIVPAATFVWDKALQPAGEFIWDKALQPAGNYICKGVSKIWNKIFHKKSKSKSVEKSS